MKTKDLIKMLQEEDPEGECHVRIATENSVGTPLKAERKEGYWDGYYSYIEDEVMHFSIAKEKVDLYIMNEEDWAETYPKTWESKVDFHFNGYAYKEQQIDHIDRIKKRMFEVAEEVKEIDQQIKERQYSEMVEKIKNGWEIIDETRNESSYEIDPIEIHFVKDLSKEKLCIGYIKILKETDFFRKEENKWKLNT